MKTLNLENRENRKVLRALVNTLNPNIDRYDWDFVDDEMLLTFQYGRGLTSYELKQVTDLTKPTAVFLNPEQLN